LRFLDPGDRGVLSLHRPRLMDERRDEVEP